MDDIEFKTKREPQDDKASKQAHDCCSSSVQAAGSAEGIKKGDALAHHTVV